MKTFQHFTRPRWTLLRGIMVAGAAIAICVGFTMLPSAQTVNGDEAVTPESVNESSDKPESGKEKIATLAGGCFWCTEAVFERMEGVNDVVSGYIGGHVVNPTYEQVCGKQTGHAEAVEIAYDPDVVKYEELLEVFFATHDPTTLNRQGADEGPQYRSAIFYHDEEQKKIAEQYIEQLNSTPEFKRRPIVTTVEKATEFYLAELYHQDYYRLNPNAGYCRAVVAGKVRKFDLKFRDKQKKTVRGR